MGSGKKKTGLKIAGALALTMALAPVGQLLAQQAEAPKAAAASTAGNAEKGKAVFDGASCGVCHTLAAASASGDIGPALDRNPNLTHDLIVARVTHGQGAMPPMAGALSEADIEDVTAYVLSAAAK